MLYAKIVGKPDNSFNTAGTFLVAVDTGFTVAFGPATISVHYYTNMGGNISLVNFFQEVGSEGFSVVGHLSAVWALLVFARNNCINRADLGAFAAVGAFAGNNIGEADFYGLNRADRVAGAARNTFFGDSVHFYFPRISFSLATKTF